MEEKISKNNKHKDDSLNFRSVQEYINVLVGSDTGVTLPTEIEYGNSYNHVNLDIDERKSGSVIDSDVASARIYPNKKIEELEGITLISLDSEMIKKQTDQVFATLKDYSVLTLKYTLRFTIKALYIIWNISTHLYEHAYVQIDEVTASIKSKDKKRKKRETQIFVQNYSEPQQVYIHKSAHQLHQDVATPLEAYFRAETVKTTLEYPNHKREIEEKSKFEHDVYNAVISKKEKKVYSQAIKLAFKQIFLGS